jgi:hypothetical protein
MTTNCEISAEHVGDQAAENEAIPTSPDGTDELANQLSRHKLEREDSSQWLQNRIPPSASATAVYPFRAEEEVDLSFPKGAKIVDIV